MPSHGVADALLLLARFFETQIRGDGIDFHALYGDLMAQPACKSIAAA